MTEQISNSNKVTVVLSANNKYSPYLATTIQSAIVNSSSERPYEFVILHTSISNGNQSLIKKLAHDRDNIDITFINLASYVKNKKFFVGGKKDLTVETYFRLFIPNVLPDRHKAVYLDCDMVVLDDLGKLFDTDLTNHIFASSQDYGAIGRYYMNDAEQVNYWHNVLQLKNVEEYFCAGMLVMNLDKLRQIGTNTIITLATQKKWKKHDQDVLNIIGRGSTIILHPKWDVLKAFDEVGYLPDYILDKVYEAEKNPSIIHYSSSYKPWNTGFVEHFEYFWEYASQTPYFYNMVKALYTNRPYQCHVLQNYSTDKELTLTPVPDDILISYGKEDIYLGKISGCYSKFEQIVIEKEFLYLRGRTMLMAVGDSDSVEIFIGNNNNLYPCSVLPGDFSEIKNGVRAYFGIGFTCRIPLSDISKKTELAVRCRINGNEVIKNNLSFGKFSPLNKNMKSSYYYANGFIVTTDKRSLYIDKCSDAERKKFEKSFTRELLDIGTVASKKAYLARKLYFLFKKRNNKKIWLFSDRTNKADDNGEAIFRYVQSNKPKRVKAYFVIDKRSPDFNRMKKIGNVVDSMSWKYKWLFLNCDKNISSQADMNTIFPFQSYTDFYGNLLNNKFVFLQHGVIKEDMSETYNRNNQNMSIFVTAATPEYYSIIDNPQYDCDKFITKLTGLPRHDRLYRDDKNIITLMPTWRKYLFRHSKTYIGVWEPKETFVQSDYFKFYNDFLNHPRLLNALKTYGYKLRFMPHPNVQSAANLFTKNEEVYFYPYDTPYSKIFAESKLVITDRSSAIMDFAYLRKPVLYCLFDDERFMSGQHVYKKGYFDYETDGFGEVSYDLETTVDNIIEYLKTNCQIKDKYLRRINNFFAFNDKNNCKRVLEEIIKLDD